MILRTVDMGEFITLLFPAACDALTKLCESFPTLDEVKARTKYILM